MLLPGFKVSFWPIFTSIWFLLTIGISYVLAIALGHLLPVFPMISETAMEPPESCIFAEMLNFAALFFFVCIYIRFREIQHAIRAKHIDLRSWWNHLSGWLGVLACIGLTFVANFQANRNHTIHYIGAAAAFGAATLYFMVQARISFAFTKRSATRVYNDKCTALFLFWYRLILSFFLAVLGVTTVVFNSIALSVFDGTDILFATPENQGYTYRLVATFSEWGMALIILLLLLSYTVDFRYIQFEGVGYKHLTK